MYKIILADGTTLDNLELNGNNFIADKEISNSVFANNLDKVVITDGETSTTHNDMVLLSNIVREGRSWIVLGEKTEAQKKEEKAKKEITNLQLAIVELYEMML